MTIVFKKNRNDHIKGKSWITPIEEKNKRKGNVVSDHLGMQVDVWKQPLIRI